MKRTDAELNVIAMGIKRGLFRDPAHMVEPKTDEEREEMALLDQVPIPTVKYTGKLRIGDLEIKVHVLDDSRRVIPEEDMINVLKWIEHSTDTATCLYQLEHAIQTLTEGGGFSWEER